MYLGRTLRALLLGLVLCGGSILGVPMRPEEIEELMSRVNQAKIEVTVDESDVGDETIKRILGRMP
jgi:hypothetical protein